MFPLGVPRSVDTVIVNMFPLGVLLSVDTVIVNMFPLGVLLSVDTVIVNMFPLGVPRSVDTVNVNMCTRLHVCSMKTKTLFIFVPAKTEIKIKFQYCTSLLERYISTTSANC